MPDEIASQVVVTIIVGIIAWGFNRIRHWVSSLNDKWSLAFSRNELARMEVFKEDKDSMTRFMLQQLLIGMTVAGAGLMFLPIALMGDVQIVMPIWFTCAIGIYGIGIHAAATALRSSNPNKPIVSLKKRITALERRIGAKTARKIEK